MGMLTYQLQKRAFHIMEKGKTFTFPNTVEVEITFEPTEMFGVGTQPTKTYVSGYTLNSYLNPDTGKCGIEPDHLFEPVEAIMEWTKRNQRFEMHGNKLTVINECKDINDLIGLLSTFYYILPLLLTIEFVEPPVIKSTVGKVGDVPFRWEFAGYTFGIDNTDKEIQEKRILDAFDRLSFTCAPDNRRLTAALAYFYAAKRLRNAGYTQYEFMSEVVLNYCKTLEALFSDNREEVRNGLSDVGYSKDEIESDFIPVMILRSNLDVGHVSLAMCNQQQLTYIYEYLEETEQIFRELLKKVMDKVKDRSYQLKRDSDFKPDNKKRKILEDISKIQENRNKKEKIKSHGINPTRGSSGIVHIQHGIKNNLYINEG